MVWNLNRSTKVLLIAIFGIYSCSKPEPIAAQELREQVEVVTPIFTVLYSETKEQPLKLTYRSTNRPKNVDRGSMNFYTEDEYHTSDNADYYRNIYDKGHLAPAATFSDSRENYDPRRRWESRANCHKTRTSVVHHPQSTTAFAG